MNLPVYRITIKEGDDEKSEVNFVALTDNPAIESNFLAFDKPLKFTVENEEERIVTGLALIADMPIYRRDKQGEYYVVFTAATIKLAAQKFFKKGYQFNFNEEHDKKKKIEDVYAFESWIVDRSKGKFPMKQFESVSDGSWFISLKVDNDETWNKIKSGEFTGFSVEGLFGLERIDLQKQEPEKNFIDQLKEILQEIEL